MKSNFHNIVASYYEELFDQLDFFMSDILPYDDELKQMEASKQKKYGLYMAECVSRDHIPFLAEKFDEASVSEKYAYLVDKFSNEYREDIKKQHHTLMNTVEEAATRILDHCQNEEASYSATTRQPWEDEKKRLERLHEADVRRLGTFRQCILPEKLQICDAEYFAFGEVRRYFPQVAEEYAKHKRNESEILAKRDPEKLYEELLLSYSREYIAEIGLQLKQALTSLDYTKQALDEHGGAKPDILSDALSFGERMKEWETRGEGIRNAIEKCEEEIERKGFLRSELTENGQWNSLALEHAAGVIQDKYPDVILAKDEARERRWAAERDAQVMEQGERLEHKDAEEGQEQSRGHGRYL